MSPWAPCSRAGSTFNVLTVNTLQHRALARRWFGRLSSDFRPLGPVLGLLGFPWFRPLAGLRLTPTCVKPAAHTCQRAIKEKKRKSLGCRVQTSRSWHGPRALQFSRERKQSLFTAANWQHTRSIIVTLRGNRGRPVAAWQPLRGAAAGCVRGRGRQEKELLAAIRAAPLNFWPLVKSRRRV